MNREYLLLVVVLLLSGFNRIFDFMLAELGNRQAFSHKWQNELQYLCLSHWWGLYGQKWWEGTRCAFEHLSACLKLEELFFAG